jgi:L-fucose mutarotase/ribose pyranase (RbsD/FucU family)
VGWLSAACACAEKDKQMMNSIAAILMVIPFSTPLEVKSKGLEVIESKQTNNENIRSQYTTKIDIHKAGESLTIKERTREQHYERLSSIGTL